jgi:hypothetical protein
MSDGDEELSPGEYLKDLAERIFQIPVMYGTDGYDYDRLQEIACAIEPGHSHNFALIETVRTKLQHPCGSLAWIRIDRFYCRSCLEQQENRHEACSDSQPEWW